MAHVLKIIPKGVRLTKRLQKLNTLKENAKNIELNLERARVAKQKLDAELLKRNNNLQRSIEAGKDLVTIV